MTSKLEERVAEFVQKKFSRCKPVNIELEFNRLKKEGLFEYKPQTP